ncbi:MAG TPA: SPOR domain-containing protein, partial [Thermoanaerobaculia bacterium]|nr:SPOR domain-containing protein [Thermoanaerobaculia bacterium]
HEVLPTTATTLPPLISPDLDEIPPLIEPPLPEPPRSAVEEGGFEEPAVPPAWSVPDLATLPTEQIPEPPDGSPVVQRVRRKRSFAGAIVSLVVVALVAAAAWGGWLWWSGREAAEQEVPDKPAAKARTKPQPPAEPTTLVAEPTTTTAPATETVATVPPAVTMPIPTMPAREQVPPAAAESDPERSRYQEMANAFRREGTSVPYTLQFEIVCQTGSVTKALEAGSSVWFVPIQYRGAPCFRVFWGRYETREAAERARNEIPAALRGSGPVVVQPRELLR